MRILHTSDWHVGQEFYGHDRGPEHDVFLAWLIEQIKETEADAILITGDIYDVANPTVDAQQRFYRFLHDALATSAHLQIAAIGGNHDSVGRVELPRHLVDSRRVHLIGGLPRRNGNPAPEDAVMELRDATGRVAAVCALIPYLRPADLPTPNEQQSPLAALYGSVFEAAKKVANEVPVILTGHLHLTGGHVSELSERRIFVGGEEAVAADIFPAEAAYVALGHLHKPQSILGPTAIRYAGAPFPMSMSERDYEHSIVLLELTPGKATTTIIRAPRPVKFLRVPEGAALPMDEVERLLRELDVGEPLLELRPYLEVAVAMESPVPDLRQRIDAALENKPVRITRVARQTAGTGGTLADGMAAEVDLAQLEPIKVFERKYFEQFNSEAPADIRHAFEELIGGVAEAAAAGGGAV